MCFHAEEIEGRSWYEETVRTLTCNNVADELDHTDGNSSRGILTLSLSYTSTRLVSHRRWIAFSAYSTYRTACDPHALSFALFIILKRFF